MAGCLSTEHLISDAYVFSIIVMIVNHPVVVSVFTKTLKHEMVLALHATKATQNPFTSVKL